MLQQKKRELAEMQAKELRTICERVSFYSEFHVDSELRVEASTSVINQFNCAFAKSGNGNSRGVCGFGFCGRLEKRLDSEMLQSEQCSLKVLQISLCLCALLLCPFLTGQYGERGICLALTTIALLLIVGLILAKLLTLNRWLTPQHWFVLEASIYGTLCLLFCLCSLALALLNAHRQFVLLQQAEDDRQNLAYVECLVLALAAATFAVDIGCVHSQRLSRTWIPSVSTYRI